MNTIIAYAGEQPCSALLTQCLCAAPPAELSGIAVTSEDGIITVRTTDTPQVLQNRIPAAVQESTVGIGGTADALVRGCSEDAAPPVCTDTFAAVLDGVPDAASGDNRFSGTQQNSAEKAFLKSFAAKCEDGALTALKAAADRYKSRSFIVLNGNDNALYCHAGRHPLYLGIAEHGFMIADTFEALIGIAIRYYVLYTGELARMTTERVSVYDKRLRRIKKSALPLQTADAVAPAMLAPDSPLVWPLTVKSAISQFISDGKINTSALSLSRRSLLKIEKIILAATGDELYAARQAAYNLMLLTDIPARAYPAGELRYSGEPIDKGTLVIAVCAAGKNEDLAVCLKRATHLGAQTLALTAGAKSPLALIADSAIVLRGANSYAAAYLALSAVTLQLGSVTEVISDVSLNVTLRLAGMLTGKVSTAVKSSPAAKAASQALSKHPYIIATGIGADCAAAGEAAVMLQRSLHARACAVPLSELTEVRTVLPDDALILCLLTNTELAPQAELALRRLLAAGKRLLVLTTDSIEAELYGEIPAIAYSDSIPLFSPLICLAGLAKACSAAAENTEREAG